MALSGGGKADLSGEAVANGLTGAFGVGGKLTFPLDAELALRTLLRTGASLNRIRNGVPG